MAKLPCYNGSSRLPKNLPFLYPALARCLSPSLCSKLGICLVLLIQKTYAVDSVSNNAISDDVRKLMYNSKLESITFVFPVWLMKHDDIVAFVTSTVGIIAICYSEI